MLQYADTFNRYGTNQALLLDGAWAENIQAGAGPTLVADPDPSSTAKVYQPLEGSVFTGMCGLRYVLSSNQVTVGMAGKVWVDHIPNSNDASFLASYEFRTNANVKICDVRINAVGGLAAYNAAGTKLGETVAPVIAAHAWNHWEVKVHRDAAAGTIEVRINGQAAALNITGLNLGANDIAQVVYGAQRFTPTTDHGPVYHKEIVIWDSTGTYNNNFMGTCAVLDIDCDSDVVLGWTPSSGGVGWSILDNNPPLDDAAYIGAAAAALTNTFGLEDLPPDVTTVRGGVIVNRSRKVDGGDGNVQMGIISGAATGLGADRPITVAYTYWKDVFEVDPNTGLPFSPANFNLAKLKMTRTV